MKIKIPVSSKINSIALDGTRLAVHYGWHSSSNSGVIIIDIQSGKIIAEIEFTEGR